MDGSMANQQGALPDPQPACHPATEDSVDLEFEILDVESQILDVATALALAASARLATSLREYLRVASELASQPAAFGGSNALASVPMPSCMNACAVQPPKSRRDSRQPARVAM